MSVFEPEIASFRRHLRSENKSDNTIRIYTDAAQRLAGWLQRQPQDGELPLAESWDEVGSGHIREWIIDLLDSGSDRYANNQYRSVQQFLRWYAAEEEVPNPMIGMSPPHVPEQPVPVLRKEQLAALLRSCAGKAFVDRRDTAILYMFMDAGVRRAEMANMMLTEVDLDMREARVRGKGRGTGSSPSGARQPSPWTGTSGSEPDTSGPMIHISSWRRRTRDR